MDKLLEFLKSYFRKMQYGDNDPANTRSASFTSVRHQTSLSPIRSKVVLGLIFFGFICLLIRALWLQGLSTDFLQRQGESRYARTLVMPAIRGKILDRNGHVLASSMEVKAVWAIPEDAERPKDARIKNGNYVKSASKTSP